MTPNVKAVLYIAGAAMVLVLGAKAVQVWGRKRPPVLRTAALLGDSMSAGTTYRTELEDLLGLGNVVQAFGYVGKQTSYIMDKVGKATAIQPTDVVVLAGVNDLASGHSAAHVISNLNSIYLQIAVAAPRARIIGVTLTPWGSHSKGKSLQLETTQVNHWILYSAPIDEAIDTTALGDGGGNLHPDLDSGDGLHLSKQGQIALAWAVYGQGFE
jgi:hypothetical protein